MKKKLELLLLTKSLTKISLIMRLSVLISLVATLQISAITYSQATRLNMNVKNVDIRAAFREIERNSGLSFLYYDQALDLRKSITISASNSTVDDLLTEMLKDTQLTFKILDNKFIVISPIDLSQQQRVTGTIVDATTGEPIPGVNILVSGTTIGVTTDLNGKYNINVPNSNAVLEFSFVGYLTEKITVEGKTQIDVKLIADIKTLEEVVVVGYGTQSRAKVTGAVSQVTSKELDGRPVRTASQALQGKIPGLVISTTSAEPGAEEIGMLIRGQNSFSKSTSPLVLIDGVEGSLDALSPDIIESVSVLKDATTAAIYGSRSANGIILVTTKRGVAGKMQVTYSSTFSTQRRTLKYESVQDPVEYMTMYNNALKYSTGSTADFYSQTDMDLFKNGTYTGTNWNEYMYKSNLVQEHRLNLTGGTDNVKFNTGFTYLDQPGIIKGFNYNRYTYFGNFDLKPNKYITAGGNISYTRGNQEEPSWERSDDFDFNRTNNVFILAFISRPTWNPTFVDPVTGETKIMKARWKKESQNRSLYDQLNNTGLRKDQSNLLNMQAYLNITPIKGLTWQTKVASLYSNDYDTKFKVQESTSWFQVENESTSLYSSASNQLWIRQPWRQFYTMFSTLSYATTIANKHNFNILAGYELNYNQYQTMNAYRSNFPLTDLQQLNIGSAATQQNGGSLTKWAIQSYFGRFNYDFDGKYLLEGVVRQDKSSRFAEGFKAAIFPSVSLGWVISKEEFMKNISFISNLKLRASWGQTGNENIGEYPYQSLYNGGNNNSYYFNSVTPGVNPGALSANQSWETTTTKNIGLDLTLLDGLFSFTAEYYNRLTSDILRGQQVTAQVGRSGPQINMGEMENKGIELSLSHRKRINSKLSYWVDANMSYNKNKLVNYGAREINGNFLNEEGREYGAWYMLKMTGIYQENDPDLQKLKVDGVSQTPGKIKYEDTNGDGNITSDDRQVVGHRYPVVNFGVNLGAQYGDFDFSAFISGVQGYNGYQVYFGVEPFAQGAAPNVYWRNAWTPENKSNELPALYYREGSGGPNGAGNQYGNHPSTFFLRDLSYIRLKNIQIGYNLPVSRLLKSSPISSFRVYVSGENLFSIYNDKFTVVDPETRQNNTQNVGMYPQLKTYSFGLVVKF
jgi:TonB-linked SusC/RagA family outer membrane protein